MSRRLRRMKMIWHSIDGPIRICDMTPRHALNAYEFMHRRAAYLELKHACEEMAGMTGYIPEMAEDGIMAYMEERAAHPHAWLDTQPIMRALWLRALDGLEV